MISDDRGGIRVGPTQKYFGPEERKSLVENILRESSGTVERDDLEFALLGDSSWSVRTGANCNAFLLSRIGERLLISGSDMGREYYAPVRSEFTMRVTSDMTSCPMHTFVSSAEVREFTGSMNMDLVFQHGRVLGRGVGNVIDELSSANFHNRPIDLSDADTLLIDSLLRLNPRVVASMAGVCGDSGLGSPRSILFLHGEPRQRTMMSREVYQETIAARTMFWAVPELTITNEPFFRNGSSGYDTRTFLPPFPPVGRNQSGIWGQILSRCYPPGCIAHIPAAVWHQPDAPRRFHHNDLFELSLRSNDVISTILQTLPQTALFTMQPEDASRVLGHQLVSLGTVPSGQFHDAIGEAWAASAIREINRCESFLDEYESSPDFWAYDVEELADRYRQSILNDHPSLMVDHDSAFSQEKDARSQALKSAQNYVRRYGKLLEIWPDVVRAARLVKSRTS